MRDITSLSSESLRLTFRYLEPPSIRVHKTDLYNCIQVNKLWYRFALPVLYERFHIRMDCPPSPNDAFSKQLASPHLSRVRIFSISMFSSASPYISEEECFQTIERLRMLVALLLVLQRLQCITLDLFPFVP
jgi:hypothetical protein